MRQLKESLKDLVRLLFSEEERTYPHCLLVNEIGAIYFDELTTAEDLAIAEEALIGALNESHINARRSALSFLVVKEPDSEEHKQKVRKFIVDNSEDASAVKKKVIENHDNFWLIW